MVTQPTTVAMKIVMLLGQRLQHHLQRLDLPVNDLRQALHPGLERRRLIDRQCRIGSKRGKDTGREVRISDHLVMGQIVRGIVGRTQRSHIELVQHAAHG